MHEAPEPKPSSIPAIVTFVLLVVGSCLFSVVLGGVVTLHTTRVLWLGCLVCFALFATLLLAGRLRAIRRGGVKGVVITALVTTLVSAWAGSLWGVLTTQTLNARLDRSPERTIETRVTSREVQRNSGGAHYSVVVFATGFGGPRASPCPRRSTSGSRRRCPCG